VEVDEDSEDAKKWPLWRPSSVQAVDSASEPLPPAVTPLASGPEHAQAPPGGGSIHTAFTSTPISNPVPATKPPARRPGPRKSKLALGSLPSPSSSSSKPKKLSTLDKSAMDWQAHVASADGDKDALEANRRGGGYLEKVEFLERVAERRDSALEENKSGKRRR
jgi:hypothetical protein